MLSKPISEVAADINPDDRCTPSYVRVPAQFPKIKYSGRTPLAEEVLNEAWVSIISGSEDYSFKVRGAVFVGALVTALACMFACLGGGLDGFSPFRGPLC
jgi:histone deacetylase complex regulatory component SIN3